MKEFIISEAQTEKAVLVGLITPEQNEQKVKEYLDELAFLCPIIASPWCFPTKECRTPLWPTRNCCKEWQPSLPRKGKKWTKKGPRRCRRTSAGAWTTT